MNILRRITAAAILLSCCAAAPATPPMDVTQLTVTEAAKLIRDGKITSEELTTALLTKIAIHQDLNAFITVNAMDALESARAADQERRRGHKRMGPLHGVPLLVKDNIHVAGLPNTAGTPGLEDFVPGANAPTVQALVDAGAIVLAKTNMHELAFGITSNNTEFGPVRNPYDKTRIAGGSSGGNASAIAARLAPGAIGTDTGGSVRIPAALCGIAALRPTIDRYSQIGVTPISHTRDTVGPMARTVEDLMLLDSVLTGDRDKSKKAKAKKIRLGVVPEMFQNIDNETSALVQHALNKLRRADVEVVPLQVSGFLQLDDQAGFPIALFEARQDLTSYLAQYGTGLTLAQLAAEIASPDVQFVFNTFIVPGAIPQAAYDAAMNIARPLLQALYSNTFESYDLDAIVFPTTPLPAAPIGQDVTVELNGQQVPTFQTYIRNTDPGTIAGVPGISLPVALTSGGLPVGLEIDGPAGSDRHLLEVALTLERILGPLPTPTGY